MNWTADRSYEILNCFAMKISFERFPINHSFSQFSAVSMTIYICYANRPPRLLRGCIHLELIKKLTNSSFVALVLEMERSHSLMINDCNYYSDIDSDDFLLLFFLLLWARNSSQRYIDMNLCITAAISIFCVLTGGSY